MGPLSEYRFRYAIAAMKDKRKTLARKVLLAFWKVHILRYAGEGPLVGQWMLDELREHVSPGTLHPLRRMERYGWRGGKTDRKRTGRGPRGYFLTKEGKAVLGLLRAHISEMHLEVVRGTQNCDGPDEGQQQFDGNGSHWKRPAICSALRERDARAPFLPPCVNPISFLTRLDFDLSRRYR